jgi:hypothetical protein
VFDVLDAKHVSFVDVAVASEQLTSEETQLFLENALNNSNGYADEMKNAVATTSSVINAVNCSRVTNFRVLYRMNCASTANTCGPYRDGFAGEFGHATRPVSRPTSTPGADYVLSSASTAVCVVDSDCDENMWRVCLNGQCAASQIYAAKAKCLCQSDYAGSSCEQSSIFIIRLWRQDMHLLKTFKISEVDDVLPDTLISWLDYLATICNDPDGLRPDTKQLIASLALDFISQASDL